MKNILQAYNKMKYYSNVNSPKVWGLFYWNKFFERAGTYPKNNPTPQQRKVYKGFYHSFVDNLPCSLCNSSFKRFWREIPIDNYLDSRKDLIMWIYLIKDKVNRKLTDQGQPKKSPPFGQILKKYY